MSVLYDIREISKQFGGLKAVDGVSMQVHGGEILGIIGPNGAGKTTFFNLITSTLPLSGGSILFQDKNITGRPANEVATLGIARTFQNINLFNFLTVLDNVKVGFHIQTRTNLFDALLRSRRFKEEEEMANTRGMELLRQVGIEKWADMTAGNLPYGLQRRLEIARGLAMDPKILLLDEPAAGMNPHETDQLMELVRSLNAGGITVVVIEHDMKFIMSLCHRIVVINQGKKLAEGTPDEISRNQQVVEAYLGTGIAVRRKRRDPA